MMSTAVLMADSWKPAVLHIAPFSNNGKDNLNGYGSSVYNNNRKSFPVLAVTRTNSADITKKQTPSNPVSRQNSLKDSRSNDKTSKKLPGTYAKKRAKSYPNTETEHPRLANFHDLNEDMAYDISLRTTSVASVDTQFSAASASLSEPPSNRYLPKPTFSNRGSYFGQSVVKRLTTLTPGEAELQKHRENYALEQAQKKPKYKLNINQLPRSTTPIEDNDPDKLNMKQVIQFLQNKNSANKNSQNYKMPSGRRYISTTATFHRRSEKVTTKQRPWSDIPGQNSTPYILDDKQDSNYESMPSARSSPDVSQKLETPRKSLRSSLSEKTHKEKRSKIELKSFKLYRFLAFAPDESGKTNEPSFENAKEISKESAGTDLTSNEKEEQKKLPEHHIKHTSPRLSNKQRKSRDISNQSDSHTDRQNVPTTANLMHRRLRERQRKTENETDSKHLLSVPRRSSSGAIRLPSMQDFYEDKVDNIVDEHLKSESDKFIIPVVCITPPMDSENTSPIQTMNSDSFFQHTQKILTPRFSISENKVDAKKVTVSVPQEMENSPVKLMLRQEKNVTREQSYMYELQSAKSVYSDYPFPQENIANSNQNGKSERATIPMSTVALRQEKVSIHDETHVPDTRTT